MRHICLVIGILRWIRVIRIRFVVILNERMTGHQLLQVAVMKVIRSLVDRRDEFRAANLRNSGCYGYDNLCAINRTKVNNHGACVDIALTLGPVSMATMNFSFI